MAEGGKDKLSDKTPPSERDIVRGDSRKKLADDGRRNKFKGRAKDLERGISAPALFATKDGENIPAPKPPLPLNDEEVVTVGHSMAHEFAKKTFFQPSYCHHCSDLLWGLKGQGYMCKVCNYVVHGRCIPFLKMPCRHILADSIQDPVDHKWTKPIHFKKKPFCNVCRKKISSEGVLCEVCKYYAHKYCKDNAFNNCKQCATYAFGVPSSDTHHWIEGNLPSSACCQVCSKGCCSTDCLTGFRCGWCGMSVHSKCIEEYSASNPICTFRDLWSMILLPRAVRCHKVIGSEEEASTPVSGEVACTSPEATDEDDDDETDGNNDGKGKPCIIVDGSGEKGFKKWRKTTVHPIYLNKKMKAHELLFISLRKCGISDDPEDYYLAEMMDSQKGIERKLSPDETPYNIQVKGYGVMRLYVKHKTAAKQNETNGSEAKGRMRINNGQLESTISHVSIPVTIKTTAAEIVKQALIRFELEDESPLDYCLTEVSQVIGVKEQLVPDSDCPYKHFHELRKDSLTMSSRQRYFLKHRRGGKTSLYLWGVAKEILQDNIKSEEYVKKLISSASTPSDFEQIEIGPAFLSQKGLLVTLPTFEIAVKVTQAIEANLDAPKICLLPIIFGEVMAMSQEPLLVFINGKSGGNQGVELISAFRRHLNPHQVWDLSQGGPIPGLWSMRNLPQFRILIGGGDGTFGWVLGVLQEIKDYLQCKEPPSALLPLGTGNDLARALKWGGGYTGAKPMQILLSLENCNVVHLDRWTVSFEEQKLPKQVAPDIHGPSSVVMNNYMGIGLDAAIALDFHLAREETPEKFNSRLHNKGYYLQLGLQKMVSKSETAELRRHVILTVDDRRVDLPDIAGLIILNIQSWAAGADPWGTSSDPAYKPAAYDDGLLEVVGIKSVMQMGQVQSGIRNAVRIAQGRKFNMDVLSPVPIQVDGEAWAQPPSIITIEKFPNSAVMLKGCNKHTLPRTTKKDESSRISLLHSLSSSGIQFSDGLSSRRSVATPTTPQTPTIPENS